MKPKFYRSKHNPTIILTREWMEEPLEIDELLREHHGSKARWHQVFAYGDIANDIYYLFKKGYKKFFLDEIHFRRDTHYRNVWTVELDTKVIFIEKTSSPT